MQRGCRETRQRSAEKMTVPPPSRQPDFWQVVRKIYKNGILGGHKTSLREESGCVFPGFFDKSNL